MNRTSHKIITVNKDLAEECNMFGTMFCQYETPCGWCVMLNKECTEKRRCKPKKVWL